MNARQEIELKLLNDYLDLVLKSEENTGQKLAIYEKQLQLCKQQGVKFNVDWYESMVYYLKALVLLRHEGFVEKTLRSTARQSSGFDGIGPALLARESEKSRVREAISFLDRAINIYQDDVDYWFFRAELHQGLKNKQAAQRDVNYILSTYDNDQSIYLKARKLKDEIDSIKSGDCFIATAVYEPVETIKVDILREYRDRVLLKSTLGRRFVSTYYLISPFIAQVISKSKLLKALTRNLLLEPIVKWVSSH